MLSETSEQRSSCLVRLQENVKPGFHIPFSESCNTIVIIVFCFNIYNDYRQINLYAVKVTEHTKTVTCQKIVKHSSTAIHLLKTDHVTQRAGVWMAERIMLKWLVLHRSDFGLKTYRQPTPAGDLPLLHWGPVRLRACRPSLCLVSPTPSRESRALGRHTAIWTTSMACQQSL